MVIFHSYVSLPEGKITMKSHKATAFQLTQHDVAKARLHAHGCGTGGRDISDISAKNLAVSDIYLLVLTVVGDDGEWFINSRVIEMSFYLKTCWFPRRVGILGAITIYNRLIPPLLITSKSTMNIIITSIVDDQ